ncbi:MAG: hypothetical protein AB9907_08895 [Flexilinea sp.]
MLSIFKIPTVITNRGTKEVLPYTEVEYGFTCSNPASFSPANALRLKNSISARIVYPMPPIRPVASGPISGIAKPFKRYPGSAETALTVPYPTDKKLLDYSFLIFSTTPNWLGIII